MTDQRMVRVGVLGAGAWARGAHLPGYRRDPRCTVVAIAGLALAIGVALAVLLRGLLARVAGEGPVEEVADRIRRAVKEPVSR